MCFTGTVETTQQWKDFAGKKAQDTVSLFSFHPESSYEYMDDKDLSLHFTSCCTPVILLHVFTHSNTVSLDGGGHSAHLALFATVNVNQYPRQDPT